MNGVLGSTDDRPCVLLAEDDIEMRKLLVWTMSREGYRVVECRDGTELQRKLGLPDGSRAPGAVDVIVSDVRMPGTSGLRALESARDRGDLPPVVLITAFPDDVVRDRAERVGAAALLAKPFDTAELVAIVRRLRPPEPAALVASDPPLPTVRFPLEVVFRHGSTSPPVRDFVEKSARKLNRFADRIGHCRVVIDALPGHRRRWRRHHVKIRVETGSRDIVVNGEASDGSPYTIYDTIHRGFRAAYRQLRRHLARERVREPGPATEPEKKP